MSKKQRKVSEKADGWYQGLSEEERRKMRQYGWKPYKHLPEKEKQ